jgi:hypothetical protein
VSRTATRSSTGGDVAAGRRPAGDAAGAAVPTAAGAYYGDVRAHPLPWGALAIDMPGLWCGTASAEAFADVDELAAGCRFADCHHDTEPGCAIRGAVDPCRLAGCRKLERQLARLDDRKAAAQTRKESGPDRSPARPGRRSEPR